MEEKAKGIERHAQTVLVAIATMMLAWVGSNVSTSGKEIVRLQEQVTALSMRLEVVAGLPDRVTRLEVRMQQLENGANHERHKKQHY